MKPSTFIKPIKNFINAYFNAATVIPAIGFSKKARYFTEKWFWIVYCVVFYIFTVFYDFRSQLEIFINEPTTSQITIMRNNSGLHFPDAQLCSFFWPRMLDFNISIEEAETVKEFLEQFEKQPEINITDYIASDILQSGDVVEAKQMSKASSRTDRFSELLQEPNRSSAKGQQEKVRQHSTLVYLTIAMLSELTRLERSSETENTEFEQWGLNSSVRLSLDHVYKFYMSRNVSFELLHRNSAAALCAKMGLWTARRNESGVFVMNPAQNCQPHMMTALGHNPTLVGTDLSRDVLCVKLSSDGIRFGSDQDQFEMVIGTSQIYSGNNTQHQDSLALESRIYFRQTDDTNPCKLRLRESFILYASILGNYVNKSLRRKPCAEHTTREKCRRLCRNNFIVRHCKCRPLTLDDSLITEKTTNRPPCATYGDSKEAINARDYPTVPLAKCSVFRNLSESRDPDPECAANCFQSCEHTVFNYHKDPVSDINEDRQTIRSSFQQDNLTYIQLQMDMFTYPQLEEIPSMNWRDLVGNVGGSFSLWMGIHLPTMLHALIFVVIYVITKCTQQLQCRKKTVTSSEGPTNTKPHNQRQISQQHLVREVSTNENYWHANDCNGSYNGSLELISGETQLTAFEIRQLRQFLVQSGLTQTKW